MSYITVKLNIKLFFAKIRRITRKQYITAGISNISLRGIYDFARLTRNIIVTVANGLHEPNESYSLIE